MTVLLILAVFTGLMVAAGIGGVDSRELGERHAPNRPWKI
jgi:hypothetical protein